MKKNSEIFSLENPEQWVYRVRFYLISHSQLQIIVTNRFINRRLFINFVGVEFFDGPFDWSGKGFSIGDKSECISILKQMDSYKDDKNPFDEFSLYVVEPEWGHRIRIVASSKPMLTEKNLFSTYLP